MHNGEPEFFAYKDNSDISMVFNQHQINLANQSFTNLHEDTQSRYNDIYEADGDKSIEKNSTISIQNGMKPGQQYVLLSKQSNPDIRSSNKSKSVTRQSDYSRFVNNTDNSIN